MTSQLAWYVHQLSESFTRCLPTGPTWDRPATKAFSDIWIEKLGRTIHADEHIGRYEFIGHLASEDIRKKYVGHKIPKRHTGNPTMSFNC